MNPYQAIREGDTIAVCSDEAVELKTDRLDRNTGTLVLGVPEGTTHFEAYRTSAGTFDIKFVKVTRKESQ